MRKIKVFHNGQEMSGECTGSHPYPLAIVKEIVGWDSMQWYTKDYAIVDFCTEKNIAKRLLVHRLCHPGVNFASANTEFGL